jgi:hypothetical protein
MNFSCPSCQKKYSIPNDVSGKTVKCTCGHQFTVPAGVQPAVPSNKPKPATAQPATKPASPIASSSPYDSPLFALSEKEWQSIASKQAAPKPQESEVSSDKGKKVNAALTKAQSDLGTNKKDEKSAANSYMYSSMWILIGLGFVKLFLNGYDFMLAESNAEFLVQNAESEEGQELVAQLTFIFRVVSGIGIVVSSLFILFGSFVYLLPMTCTVSALGLFVLVEIFTILLNPFLLLSFIGWVIRGAIFGGLVQAINNASYYKFVRRGGRK